MAAVYLDRMRLADLDEVLIVEREAYSLPWPNNAYRDELRNSNAHYLVARRGEIPDPDLEPAAPLRERRAFPFSLLPVREHERPPVRPRDPVIGHGGIWKTPEDGHITTIAVRNGYRGQGIGELLLVGLIDLGYEIGSPRLTLEVRVSNIIAQRLYRKYGFLQVGSRRRYYSDNNEDAFIMTTEPIDSASFRAMLAFRRQELAKRMGVERLSDILARPRRGGS